MALYLVDDVAAGQKVVADDLNPALGIVARGTYVPDISSNGGTVAYGADGYHVGKWRRIGVEVTAIMDIYIFGSGLDFGGSSWRLELPFAADLDFHAADVLAPATPSLKSDALGVFIARSGTPADSRSGVAILSGPDGDDDAGTHLIFYNGGENGSLGASDFTTSARLKVCVSYQADPDAF